jgi:rubrerythrin
MKKAAINPNLYEEECPNPKCGYVWVVRVEQPKKCPKCGHRLDKKQNETEEDR